MKRYVKLLTVMMSLLIFLCSSDKSCCIYMYNIYICIYTHINTWYNSKRRETRAAEDEMVGWHHRLNGHELGQTLGDSEGQGGLACYRPWGRRKSDMT